MTLKQLVVRTALVVVVALIAGAAAYVFSKGQEEKFQATTRLLFAPSPPEQQIIGIGGGNVDKDFGIADNVQQVKSFDIAKLTAAKLPQYRLRPGQVGSMVHVSQVRGSDVVTIAVLAPEPAEAAAIATRYRHEFILRQRQKIKDRASVAQAALRDSLSNLSRRSRLSARGETLRYQIGLLTVLSRAGKDPIVVEGTRASATAVQPKTKRNVLFGLLFGALLGIGLVALQGAVRQDRDVAES